MKEKNKVIIGWIEKKVKRKLKKKDFSKNIFDSGLIDSFTGVELIVFLEKKFKFKISNAFIQNKNKQTINEILKIIKK